MKRIGWASVIAVFLALSAFAYGMLSARARPPADATPPSLVQHAGTHDPQATPTADAPSTLAYREANDRMHRNMAIAYTGDADIDFLRGMIAHHDGAVAMAKVAVDHGEAADVQSLAREIIAAQEAEIIRMRILLARHEDVPALGVRP
ncbi:DUF305 domain-containing protein [Brevundimonas lutea]|uniref:CopM family metallochaperone n=1 Tax=Brevundimonas lutea TaxID=2293980 RepID=UPI000F035B82|nr:DUF305 domain-containing protein [Brevundimonas lutea]